MRIKSVLKILSALLVLGIVLTACNDEKADVENSVSEADTEETTLKAVSDGSAKVTVDGTKFIVNGKEIWFCGVNTPWDNWNDFGGSGTFDEAFWDSHFKQLHEAGINCSRVWVNCNSMVGVKLKTTGEFKEVTEQHWTDLDKLFAIAEKYEVYLMPTLLSFDHFKDSNSYYDRWRAMITSPENTDSFVKGYVIPFAERYGKNEYLLGIDLINEPDWVVENDECGKIGWEHISRYFAKAAAGIHENSDTLVTAGIAMIKYNSDNRNGNYASDEYLKSLGGENAYLDFYSTHYYYWMNSWAGFPFEMSPTDFTLDGTKPCIIGETAANGDNSGRTLTEMYQSAYNKGWNGVLAWTSNGIDKCGGFEDIKPAAEKMNEIASDKIFPIESPED